MFYFEETRVLPNKPVHFVLLASSFIILCVDQFN